MHYTRLRNLREDKDMTQKQLAAILHCSQRIYSNYERGDVDIPTEILIRLSTVYNTSIDYILDQTDVKIPYARKQKK
ncbi:HTH-type transcriptional regulator ImmR [Lachnospiraceae bacterium]|nr:HTH-type transcriptional regulator ImmR [Lachnospiraceae bacterium]